MMIWCQTIESSNYPAFEVVDVEAVSDQHVEDFWICMDLRLLNFNNELNLPKKQCVWNIILSKTIQQ